MKKNNKGFMLVEVIITSVVVATAMIGLYTLFNKIYNLYNKNISYYNVDSIYAIKTSINYLFDNGFADIVNNDLSTNDYKVLMDNNECFENGVTCNEIKNIYKINKLVIVKCNKTALESLKSTSINETFKDYINYVINYHNITDTDNRFAYIVLTEIDGRLKEKNEINNNSNLSDAAKDKKIKELKEFYYYGNMLLDDSAILNVDENTGGIIHDIPEDPI